eukprot:SAG31_NODE_43_length_31224_cov_10.112578_16_plen_100_part_00
MRQDQAAIPRQTAAFLPSHRQARLSELEMGCDNLPQTSQNRLQAMHIWPRMFAHSAPRDGRAAYPVRLSCHDHAHAPSSTVSGAGAVADPSGSDGEVGP